MKKNYGEEHIDYSIDVVRKAGDLLLELFENSLTFEGKSKGVKDIVTEADLEAERLIKALLKDKYPEIRVISEEADCDLEHSDKGLGNAWVIDPLDGTRNFSIGNPNFVVSIGYVDNNGDFSGVIYYPVLDQIFVAVNGKAYLDGKEIHVNEKDEMDDAIVAFWDKREKDPDWNRPEIYNNLRGKVKVVRVFGASALEKSWVATGQVDLYVGNSSSIFGAVAGVALVRNAGGVCYSLEGNEWKLGDVGIVCGCEVLVNKVLQEIN